MEQNDDRKLKAKGYSPPGRLCAPETSNMLQGHPPAQELAIEGTGYLAMNRRCRFLQNRGLIETRGWETCGRMTTEVDVEGIVPSDVNPAIVKTSSLGVGRPSGESSKNGGRVHDQRRGYCRPFEEVWELELGSEDKRNGAFLLVDKWRATCRRQNDHLEKSIHPNHESWAILRPIF